SPASQVPTPERWHEKAWTNCSERTKGYDFRPKSRLTKKLLPDSQSLNVCSEHGSFGFGAGERQPGKRYSCRKLQRAHSGRRRYLLPRNFQATEIYRPRSARNFRSPDHARTLRSHLWARHSCKEIESANLHDGRNPSGMGAYRKGRFWGAAASCQARRLLARTLVSGRRYHSYAFHHPARCRRSGGLHLLRRGYKRGGGDRSR